MSEIVWDSIKQNGREREGGRVRELFFSGVFIYRGSTCCQVCTSMVDHFCEI